MTFSQRPPSSSVHWKLLLYLLGNENVYYAVTKQYSFKPPNFVEQNEFFLAEVAQDYTVGLHFLLCIMF